MSTETSSFLATEPTLGQYAPAPPNASRSPCPVVNALANHGHIERSGRKIYMKELNASMQQVGMSSLLGSIFAVPTYFEYHNPSKGQQQQPVGFLNRLWRLVLNPYAFFDYFGCWQAGRIENGKRYIDLEHLASYGAIEHDISLSRRDFVQKQGNNAPQKDLIDALMQSSSDGGQTLTVDDLGAFIKGRIRQQLKDNPELVYGPAEHQVNCGQVALMMHCFGNGKTIPCNYVRAIFEEERLPFDEGWKKRSWWWPMGMLEFFGAVRTMQTAVGLTF